MASKTVTSVTLFLAVNLLLLNLTVATSGTCPRDSLQITACANVLNGLLNLNIGSADYQPCCSLISGLVDLDAQVCLCSALNLNVLGVIKLSVPLDLSLALNTACHRSFPGGFQCA